MASLEPCETHFLTPVPFAAKTGLLWKHLALTQAEETGWIVWGRTKTKASNTLSPPHGEHCENPDEQRLASSTPGLCPPGDTGMLGGWKGAGRNPPLPLRWAWSSSSCTILCPKGLEIVEPQACSTHSRVTDGTKFSSFPKSRILPLAEGPNDRAC